MKNASRIGAMAAAMLLAAASARSSEQLFEAETFTRLNAQAETTGEQQHIVFVKADDSIERDFEIPKPSSFSAWLRVFFPSSSSRTVFFSIDGVESNGQAEVSDRDYNRWHWVYAGRYTEAALQTDLSDSGPESETIILSDITEDEKTREENETQHLARGKHRMILKPTTEVTGSDGKPRTHSPGLGVKVDKVALYFGAQVEKEPWFLEANYDLLGRKPNETRLMSPKASSLVIEAESADRATAKIAPEPGASGGNALKFAETNDEALFMIECRDTGYREVWALAYYDAAGNTLGGANSIRFCLDGTMRKLITGEDTDRWHWAYGGRHLFKEGRHLIAFRADGLPVKLDKIVLYAGKNAVAENWFQEHDRMAGLLAEGSAGAAPVFAKHASHLSLKPADARRKEGTEEKTLDDGAKVAELLQGKGELDFLVEFEEAASARVFALVKCEQLPSRFRLYLDAVFAGAFPFLRAGTWRYVDCGLHKFHQGRNLISILNPRSALFLDEIVLYAGSDVRRETWFQRRDTMACLLFSPEAEPAPERILKAPTRALHIPARTADRTSETETRTMNGKDGGASLVFVSGDSEAHFVARNEETAVIEVWARLYFDSLNAKLGDANSIAFSIDGGKQRVLSDNYRNEWHWVLAGRQKLEKGRHVLSFHGREAPVGIDEIVFYSGTNAPYEDWYRTGAQAYNLPFGLKNNISQANCATAGAWKVFGELAEAQDVTIEASKTADGAELVRVHVPAGHSGARLVLEHAAGIATPKRRPGENNSQRFALRIREEGAGMAARGVCVDASGERFEGVFDKIKTPSGRNEMAMNIGKDGRYPDLRVAGGNADGRPDYPVTLRFLVFEKTAEDASALTFEEPLFVAPVRYRAGIVGGKDSFDEGQTIDVALVASNVADTECSIDLACNIASVTNRFSREMRAAAVLPPGGRIEHIFRVACGPPGIYEISCGAGPDLGRRLFFGVGDQSGIEKFKTGLERDNDAFRFSPDGRDISLRRKDGSPIGPDEVASLYGAEDGFAIHANGIDVCSGEYAERQGFDRLAPMGADLSDGAGWPFVEVPPGTVAIDPNLGRFKFYQGDGALRPDVVSRLQTGFGVPGNGYPAIRGNLLYLPPGEGDLSIVDISDKKKPFLKSILPTPFFFYSANVYKDKYVYIRGSRSGNSIGDLSTGSIRQSPLDSSTFILGFNEEHEVAYAHRGSQFLFLDLTDPWKPVRIAEIESGNGFWLIRNGRFAVTQFTARGRLGFIDISDPRKPFISHTIPLLGNVVSVDDEYVVVSDEDRLGVYRFIGDTALRNAGFVTPPACGRRSILTYGDHLYVVDGQEGPGQYGLNYRSPPSHWYTYRIDHDAVYYVNEYTDPYPTAYSFITIDDHYAYVNDYNFGIWIFDLSNPAKPLKIGAVPTAGEGHCLCLGGKYAYMFQTFGGTVFIIDVSDVSKPTLAGYFWDGRWVNYRNSLATGIMGYKDNYLFLSKNDIQIVNVSDPANPIDTGRTMAGEFFTISGDFAYTVLRKEVRVYDLAQPGNPRLVGQLTTRNPHQLICQRDNLLYLAEGDGGKMFTIIDVSNPAKPAEVSQFDLSTVNARYSFVGGLTVRRGYAYVTSGQQIHVLDVRDPAKPEYVKTVQAGHAYWDWANFLMDIASSRDYLFACNYGGIEIFDISAPENPQFISFTHTGWFQWSLGEKRGPHLYVPGLRGLDILKVPYESETPLEKIAVRYN